MIAKFLIGLAAFGLVATPVAAQDAAANFDRSAAPVANSEELSGESGLLAVFAVIAIIAGVFLITGGDNEDRPTSP